MHKDKSPTSTTSGINYNRQQDNLTNNTYLYTFQSTLSGNHHDQSYRLHIQQAGLRKGEITAILSISDLVSENQNDWMYQSQHN